MTNILRSALLGTLLTIGTAALAAGTAVDPVIGTWKLNVAKSKFGSSHVLKSQTRIYSQSDKGITIEMKSVSADGKDMTTIATYQFDGKDYPVTGAAEYDSLSGRQIDANTAEFTLKKAGKTVATTRRTVSKDGKILTATADSSDAKGMKSQDLMVFDKQ